MLPRFSLRDLVARSEILLGGRSDIYVKNRSINCRIIKDESSFILVKKGFFENFNFNFEMIILRNIFFSNTFKSAMTMTMMIERKLLINKSERKKEYLCRE